MPIASLYDTDFRRFQTTITSATDAINAIVDEITNQLSSDMSMQFPNGSKWTSLGGGVYKSPVDSAGRFMTVTLTTPTSTRVGFEIKDQVGSTLYDGSFDLTNPSLLTIWSGPYHLSVWVDKGGGFYSWSSGFMLDPSPEEIGVHQFYTIARTKLDSSGVDIGIYNGDFWYMLDGSGVAGIHRVVDYNNTANPSAVDALTSGGSYIAIPAEVMRFSPSRVAGKMYQTILVSKSIPAGTIITNVDVGGGIVADFEVSPQLPFIASIDSPFRLAYRKE
jgi:hypothetical protein